MDMGRHSLHVYFSHLLLLFVGLGYTYGHDWFDLLWHIFLTAKLVGLNGWFFGLGVFFNFDLRLEEVRVVPVGIGVGPAVVVVVEDCGSVLRMNRWNLGTVHIVAVALLLVALIALVAVHSALLAQTRHSLVTQLFELDLVVLHHHFLLLVQSLHHGLLLLLV